MRKEFGSIRRFPSGNYQARYMHHGTMYTAPGTFSRKSAARAWLDDEQNYLDRVHRGLETFIPPKERAARVEKAREAKKLTVGAWLDQYYSSRTDLKLSTAQKYWEQIERRITKVDGPARELAQIPLNELTRADVYKWWDRLKEQFPGTIETNKKAYQRLRQAVDEAVDRELIGANPVKINNPGRGAKPKEKVLPTTGEVMAIIDETPDRYKAITVLCLAHGLRIGEALGLQRQNVVFGTRDDGTPTATVLVRGNVQRVKIDDHWVMHLQTPKTKAGTRDVPVLPQFVQLLRRHVGTYTGKKPEDWLTTTSRGNVPFDTMYRDKVFKPARERAKVNGKPVDQGITPHCGRHWVATTLHEAGYQAKLAGKLIGQADVNTTFDIYTDVSAGLPEKAMQKLGEELDSEMRREHE